MPEITDTPPESTFTKEESEWLVKNAVKIKRRFSIPEALNQVDNIVSLLEEREKAIKKEASGKKERRYHDGALAEIRLLKKQLIDFIEQASYQIYGTSYLDFLVEDIKTTAQAEQAAMLKNKGEK